MYVLVAQWQFQCCGDTPEVGGQVSYPIHAFPPTPPVGPWVADPPSWVPGHGPRMLWADWHHPEPVPVARGVIAELYERSVMYRREPESTEYKPVPGSERLSPITAARRWPEEDNLPYGRQVAGVVAGIRVESILEPDAAEIAAYRDDVERNRRTLTITGPPEAFGSFVPEVGARLSVDVRDPRLDVVGEVADGPVVAGEAFRSAGRFRMPTMGSRCMPTLDAPCDRERR